MGPRDVSESWEVGRSRCLGALVNSAQEPPAKGPVGLGLELPPTGFGRSPGEGIVRTIVLKRFDSIQAQKSFMSYTSSGASWFHFRELSWQYSILIFLS